MLTEHTGRPSAQAELIRTIGLLGVVAAIGAVDFWSGPNYGFALFYLFPVVAAAWLITSP